MPIKHPFVSGRDDGGDPGAVQPSGWNAEHQITGMLGLLDALANLPNMVLAFNGSGVPYLKPVADFATSVDANLTGTPTAPTAAPGTNTTQIATTAFVKAAIDAIIGGAPGALDTLYELATALGNDANFAAVVNAAIALRLRVDVAQGLSLAQKAQGRDNLGINQAVALSASQNFDTVAAEGTYFTIDSASTNAPVGGALWYLQVFLYASDPTYATQVACRVDSTATYRRNKVAGTWSAWVSAETSFLQAGTGAVTRTMQNKARDIVSVKDFGAVGDSVANDTAAIAAALAATPDGGTLYFPAGVYKVIGSGSAVFTITKAINIVGAGMYGSLILVDTSVPTSRDVFYVLPPNGSVTRGYSIRDIMITSAGNPGRDVLRIDTTQSNTTELAEFDISRCFFYASGGGYSIHHLNVASNANGGLFNSNIDKNVILGGIHLNLTGDSIRIRDNIISTANAGISGSQIPGAGNLLIAGNNISGQSGGIVVSQTIGMVIENNEFEQQATNLEANNSIVDLTNTVGVNDHPIITNNQIQANAGTGNPTLLRLGQSTTGAVVEYNRFGTPAAYVPMVIAAGSSLNYIGDNAWPGLGAANVTDGGTGTKHVQVFVPIMGSSGSVQVAAGSTNFVTPSLINASEALVYLPFPANGIVSALAVYSQGAPGAGQSYTYTFRKGLADTALTCAISGAASNSAQDLTNSVAVAAGDRWSVKVVASAGAAATNVLFSFKFAATA